MMNSVSMVVFVLFNDKGMAEIGLSNIGDDTKFDLNAGKFVSPKWLVRGGIFESELGVGVDYNFTWSCILVCCYV